MVINKLAKMPYAQAHVEKFDDGSIYLFSYTTCVAEIDKDGFLTIFGLYSMTTRKHISAFMSEYTPNDYKTAKAAYDGNYRYNIYTGEIEDIG